MKNAFDKILFYINIIKNTNKEKDIKTSMKKENKNGVSIIRTLSKSYLSLEKSNYLTHKK